MGNVGNAQFFISLLQEREKTVPSHATLQASQSSWTLALEKTQMMKPDTLLKCPEL